MMRESDYKAAFVKDVRAKGGYARRIEDRFSVGMPDMIIIPPDMPVLWFEGKVLAGNILRAAPRQYVELARLWIPPHSYSFTIGWKTLDTYICKPDMEGTHINQCLKKSDFPNIILFIEAALEKFK